MNESKSAFAAIVGKANVGKSSILNRLIGSKIAIVSGKPCLLYTSPSPRD